MISYAFLGKKKNNSQLLLIRHSQNILPRSVVHVAMMVGKPVTSAKQYNCQSRAMQQNKQKQKQSDSKC